jgi:hypothetical protein
MVDDPGFDNALLCVQQDSKIVILYCDFDKVVKCIAVSILCIITLVHRRLDRFYFPLPAVPAARSSQPMPI